MSEGSQSIPSSHAKHPCAFFTFHIRTTHIAWVLVFFPLGLITYMAYLWREIGDPLAFLSAQQHWGGLDERWGKFLDVFIRRPSELLSGDHVYVLAFLNLVLFIIALALIPVMIRRLPGEISIFTVLVMLQGASSLQSLGRYLLPAIGVYFTLAVLLDGNLLRRSLRTGVGMSSIMLMTMLAILFAQAKWVL